MKELTFRFNRRTSHRRGLLSYRLIEGASGPLTYDQLAKITEAQRFGEVTDNTEQPVARTPAAGDYGAGAAKDGRKERI
ncbi:MAG: hypothetical protein M0008_07180 [Actinomycetota bacterium]|nr:hypothetical protein [Actinomycetota bacterium]